MDYNTFLDTITRRASVPPEKAEPLTRATLETLAELSTLRDAVSDGEFRHVMSQLPRDFEALVGAPG